jgi:steroid 5-alpha reductase family enzyme
MNEIGQALLTTFLIDFGIQFVAFAFSAYLHTEKFYDLAGSITYQSAIIYGLVNANIKHGTSARQFIMAICGLVWALRLGMFLFVRVLRHTDKRFDQLKNDPIKFTIPWVLQVIWIYITAFPIYLICANDASLQAPIQASDIIGLIIWIFGFTVEAVADHQKFKFKNENPRDFMKTGLFQYSRYPNYFGEVVLWYGMWITSIGGYEQSWQWVSVISPLFVTALLYFGSGVALGETNALKNYGSRADYQEYRAKTNKFVPWFPKKNATIPFPAE